jgi:hypothetical protein
MNDPKDWFWKALDATRPSLAALESWLMNASQEHVEQFAAEYELAAQALCDYWDGPIVDGVEYSEDDTEDLCDWVVAQGRELWHKVKDREIDIGTIALVHSRGNYDLLPVPVSEWTTEVRDSKHRGYQDPASIASGVYRSRFGVDLPTE